MIIQNNQIKVTISSMGAEVKSVIKNGIEYMWQANPEFWKRTSPVLFPFVGKLTNDNYIYREKTYTMSQHGFARDNVFKLLEATSTKAVYLLQESTDTLFSYPFKFTLTIAYEVKACELLVTWTVVNNGKEEMPFQIGAHPAFNFLNGSKIDIHKKTNHYRFDGTPHVQRIIKDVTISTITVDDDTFSDNALVFDHIEEITLRDDQKSVRITCPGFPFFGIWSNTINGCNAPFICLEPWHGITDFKNHNLQLKNKKHMNTLNQKETFSATYKIIFS